MVEAEREAQDERAGGGPLARMQLAGSQQRRTRIYNKTGRAPEGGPAGNAARSRDHANALQQALNKIEALFTVEAAHVIRGQHAEAEAKRDEAERARVEHARTRFKSQSVPAISTPIRTMIAVSDTDLQQRSIRVFRRKM